MSDRRLKVSAAITAYNHERFIGEAIEGFLRQKTDFACELVIVDDCSTDGTREVIRRYWERHPQRLRVLLNRHNIGACASIVRAYDACRGEYVATMDGDDYWVCPEKLQRQADFLDGHPDCALCFHSVTAVWDDGRREPVVMRPPRIKDIYTLADLLECNFIQACSPMYRRGVFREHPAWVYLTPVMDWAHHILHARYGAIGYIDEPMGVYRQHDGGVYSMHDTTFKLRIAVDTLRRLVCVVPREHRGAARRSLCRSYCRLAREYCDRGRYDEARRCVTECLQEIGLCVRDLEIGGLLRVAVRAGVPGLHHRYRRILKQGNPVADGPARVAGRRTRTASRAEAPAVPVELEREIQT